MLISKRALSKIYNQVDREEQKRLILLEKEIDNYVKVEKVKTIPVRKEQEVSILLEVENLPQSIINQLKRYEHLCGVKVFVSSPEEDVKVNSFR
ncbi:hypothetical protein [Desulfurobacterium sp.]|uniref:hypothetical protein n=1 Tax=Desulfurobacterium sp. TaxID=2004706 RepID=UPI00261412BA|nr:hypothetical protein [Desulfurobacterium sp.]